MAPLVHRPLALGRNGAVASNHPVATLAGLDVLRAGGNAVDAAVATAFTVGVAEPHMSGVGGDAFYHVHDAAAGRGIVYNATGRAPAAATPEAYAAGIPDWGPRSISTPGMVAGLSALHAAHGTKPWGELLRPAIAAAREGFGVTRAYRFYAAQERARLADDARSRKTFLGPDGGPPPLGALIVQPELAATLEEIAADRGESFYRGATAGRLVADLAGRGALLSLGDMAECAPQTQEPLRMTYRGYELRQTPPNSTGFTLLQSLKIAERFDLKRLGHGSADLVHHLVEAKKRAFLDRERYGMDPRFGDIPLERLLSDAHADACAALIDPERAALLPVREGAGDTTYFCVVDRDGNAVSGIQSINRAFGSGVVAGDTGVLMNDRMTFWHLEEGHANRLQPGKRVRHTMNAPMVFRDGRLWAVFGTPGGDNQVQVNLQILTSMIDFGFDPQEAVEAPRWSSCQPGQEANFPHGGNAALTIEDGFGEEVLAELERRGHILARVGPLAGPCSVEAIRVLDTGLRAAGSDPRRDGWALAY